MSDIDLNTVPPYPIYRLELDANGTVTIDGVPIATGTDATEAAIDHIAATLQDDGHEAVRVIAVTPEGTERMVIEADGTTHLIREDVDDGKIAIGSRRINRRTFIASLATFAGLVVIGAGTPIAIAATRPAPAATPAATMAPPPGAGAQLPVLAPPGYAQTATWSVPIRANTSPTFIRGGRVAITTEAGDLHLLDVTTGRTVWKGSGAPRGNQQLAATSIDGRDVLATARSSALTVWPTDLEVSVTDSVDYDLPRGAKVTFLGTEPLVELPNQTVGFLTAEGVTRHDIPVTARPVLASSAGVIAVDENAIHTITREGDVTSTPYARPEGAGAIAQLSAVNTDTLIIVWAGIDTDDTLALVDVATGDVLASAPARTPSLRQGTIPLHAIEGDNLTYGSIWIRYGSSPSIRPLDNFTPTATTGSMVYGTANRRAGVTNALDDPPQVIPFTTQELPTPPIAPTGITPDTAWVVAEKVETTYLYALPHQNNTPTGTPAP